MRFPSECYQIHQTIRQTMPHLTEAQSKGLALWTFGTITAQSGCQNAVIAALNFTGGFSAVRQRLREWLYDGADRSTPSPNQIDVRACFAPLMRWVLSLWKSSDLPLAIDPTMLSDRLCAVVVSAVYRGCAIPVAWTVLPANKPGKWIDPICELLDSLSVAIPDGMRVIVMADRGLRSPKLWKKIRKLGRHPYMRQRIDTVFCLDGGMRMPARNLVPALYPVIPAKAGIQRVATPAKAICQRSPSGGLPFPIKLAWAGLRPWERGRDARIAALARVTLILAFSHKGRRDPLTAICTCGGLGCNRLDSRFRGNDGVRKRGNDGVRTRE